MSTAPTDDGRCSTCGRPFDANDREGSGVAGEPTVYRVGGPDPTADPTEGCMAGHLGVGTATGYLCSRPALHPGPHIAGNGETILAVWDA